MLAFVLLDYTHAWQHVEMVLLITPAAFRGGADLSLSDLPRAFDWIGLDGYERARFLSNLFNLVSIKLRFLLAEFVPPHPSWSLSWVLLLFVAPLLVYRAMLLMARDRGVALAATALFLVAPGTISGVAMLFHAGKPLVLTFAAAILYLLARADTRRARGERVGPRDWIIAAALFVAGFLSMNSDESGGIFLIAAWAFFPALLMSRRGMLLAGSAATCILAFGFWLFVAAPAVVEAVGYGQFDFLAASARLHVTERGQLPSFLSHPSHYAWNGYVLLAEMLVPANNLVSFHAPQASAYWPWLEAAAAVPSAYPVAPASAAGWWGALLAAAVGASLLLLVSRLSMSVDARRQRIVLGAAVAHVTCAIALTALNTHALLGAYYYGNLASLPLVMGLAAALAPVPGSRGVGRTLALGLVAAIAFTNAASSNLIWRHTLGEARPTRFDEVWQVWKGGDAPGDWRWLSEHQRVAKSLPAIREAEDRLDLWAGGFAPNARPEIAYILAELHAGLRIGFLNYLVGQASYNRGGDLTEKLRETCQVCVRVGAGDIEAASVRGVDVAAHPLPEEIARHLTSGGK